MRHYKKGRKLGTDASHTKAMKKSLCVALFTNDRIKTVEARAKEIRPEVDRIITWAKRGDLHSRRLAIAALGDKELVREVFEKVEQGQFKDREGGYTRIMKLGNRKGDNAPMVILELVTEPVQKKGKKKADKKDEAAKPVAAKAEEATEEVTEAAEEVAEAASEEAAEVAEVTAETAEEATEAVEDAAEEVVEEATETTEVAEAAEEAEAVAEEAAGEAEAKAEEAVEEAEEAVEAAAEETAEAAEEATEAAEEATEETAE